MRGERHKEFDLSVETPDGHVVKLIEVTSIDAPVSAKGDARDGVRHAVDKVVDRQGSTEPLTGSREALIHMALDVGKKPTEGGGQIREILPDGTLTFFRPDGKTPIPSRATSGNLYQDIAANISNVKNHHLLDRITLVDQFKQRIVFEREGKVWKWVRPE
jgi:predicted nuclease with RNAse H fold